MPAQVCPIQREEPATGVEPAHLVRRADANAYVHRPAAGRTWGTGAAPTVLAAGGAWFARPVLGRTVL